MCSRKKGENQKGFFEKGLWVVGFGKGLNFLRLKRAYLLVLLFGFFLCLCVSIFLAFLFFRENGAMSSTGSQFVSGDWIDWDGFAFVVFINLFNSFWHIKPKKQCVCLKIKPVVDWRFFSQFLLALLCLI